MMGTRTSVPPVVVKIGGALLTGNLDEFWSSVASLVREKPVLIVHGGGPEATRVAHRLNHEPEIVQGRRVTTATDLEIVEWVTRGSLNTRLVGQAHAMGLPAVGLSGVDGGTVRVVKRPPWIVDGREIDFGFVGDVTEVQTSLLNHLLSAGFIPVVAPLGVDDRGQAYNVNADTIASALAKSLEAQALLLVTETGSLRRFSDRPESVIPECTEAIYQEGLTGGWITDGMRVKLHVAFEALRAGVDEVFIVSPNDLLDKNGATRVVP